MVGLARSTGAPKELPRRLEPRSEPSWISNRRTFDRRLVEYLGEAFLPWLPSISGVSADWAGQGNLRQDEPARRSRSCGVQRPSMCRLNSGLRRSASALPLPAGRLDSLSWLLAEGSSAYSMLSRSNARGGKQRLLQFDRDLLCERS